MPFEYDMAAKAIGNAAKGGGGMNPYVMGAGAALDAVGGILGQQQQNRQYNLDKFANNRAETQGMLDRINAQKRRVGQTGTNSALLQRMAQMLGLPADFKFGATQELAIKPTKGGSDVTGQFQKYYGYGPMGQAPGAPGSALPPRPQPQRPSLQSLLGSIMGGRNG